MIRPECAIVDRNPRRVVVSEEATGSMMNGETHWEGFTSVWPTITNDPSSSARTRDLGNWLAAVEKVVFSTTLKQEDLEKSEWTNARVSANVETEVAALRSRPGRDILVLNSASIIQTLLRADLVDDLYLTVVPSTLGSGRRVLPDDYASKWRLATATAFPSSGAVALHYQRP